MRCGHHGRATSCANRAGKENFCSHQPAQSVSIELVVVLEALRMNHIHPIFEDLIDLAFFVVREDE